MAIPIINDWEKYFHAPHEGLGSSYERIILNELILRIAGDYAIDSAIESPSFGFTGTSGINLVALAKTGCKICLEDHDQARLERIAALWQSLKLPLTSKLATNYSQLDYPDDSVDLGFNFSALWFTADLSSFIKELCRVCSKAILICVPNRNGIGYKMQIKDYNAMAYPSLHPQHIDPNSIKYLMRKNGWSLTQENYIDCPPWPDIGMSKELFFRRLLKLTTENTESAETANTLARLHPHTILPYYRDEDAGFAARMLRYAFVERTAPRIFKRYWAHHYYMLFTSPGEQNK